MTHGYVFRLAAGIWGILAYLDRPTVFCRIIETDSVYDACAQLGRQFAGAFSPADTDQIAWAKVVHARHPAILLTDQ